jgi:hypothetical protein
MANLPPGAVDTVGGPLLANISVIFQTKFEMILMLFSGALGEDDS